MANPSKNYETTGGTVDGGGARPTDWTKLEGWTGGINPNGMYTNNVTSTPVLCKDGTTKSQTNDPNARVLDACRDNGGRAENQTVLPLSVTDPELFKKNMELSAKKDEKMKQLKYGLIAVVLVAGYFAYKKFKK
jgi:hypothetical protein